MDLILAAVVALFSGCVAAVLVDYGYHRLMHVPFGRGPLRTLFLYHAAHHRFPDDPRILSFRPLRRGLDAAIAVGGTLSLAALWMAQGQAATASVEALMLVLPSFAYNHAYDRLHAWVHVGGSSWLLDTAVFRSIRAHHLAHHEHAPGLLAFRRARGFSLIFPFV